MDEELYAKNVDVSQRTFQSLISEFQAVRSSTEKLFENLTDAQSKSRCNVVTHPMTARAIGYFIIGHVRHHLRLSRKDIFELLQQHGPNDRWRIGNATSQY